MEEADEDIQGEGGEDGMILVGLTIENHAMGMEHSTDKDFFEAKDIHEAASKTKRSNWSTGWQLQEVADGEFHDTDTHKTWSVDRDGHTKRDYRIESDKSFKDRWNEVNAP